MSLTVDPNVTLTSIDQSSYESSFPAVDGNNNSYSPPSSSSSLSPYSSSCSFSCQTTIEGTDLAENESTDERQKKTRKMSQKHFQRQFPHKLDGVYKILTTLRYRLQCVNDQHSCSTTCKTLKSSSQKNDASSVLAKGAVVLDDCNNADHLTSHGVVLKKSKDSKNIIKKKTFSDVEKVISLIQELKTLNENHPSLRKLGHRAPTGLEKLRVISPKFASFANWNVDEKKSRCHVTQKLCNYIKEKKLQRENNLRQFVIDPALSNLFNFEVGSIMTYPDLQKHLYMVFENPQQQQLLAEKQQQTDMDVSN